MKPDNFEVNSKPNIYNYSADLEGDLGPHPFHFQNMHLREQH